MGTEVINYVLGIAAGLSVLPLIRIFNGLWDRLFRDIPNISGRWKTTYNFVLEGEEEVESGEYAEVSRFGRWFTAETFMRDGHSRAWKLSGEVRGRYWAGKVTAADQKTLSGTGVFQLKIWEHAAKMEGYMLWWDGALDRIYVTTYTWERSESAPI